MKKITLLLILMAAVTFKVNAQPPKYDDLLILFADGDYAKLLKKAEQYTQGDKTRKDAIPYLYLSMANYEISKGADEELTEKYPRAAKDAIKYAGKCIQKDKDGSVYNENLEFFTKLKNAIIEDLRNYVDANDWARLSGKTPLMQKVDKADIGIHYLKAAVAYYKKDRKGMTVEAQLADKMLEEADPSKFTINEDEDVDITNKKKADLEMLKLGVIAYAQALVDARQEQKAKEVLGKVAQWFENDEEFKSKYDEIVN